MTLTKLLFHMMLVFAVCLTIAACSGGTSPTSPTSELPESFGLAVGERNIIAVYDAVIDPDAGTFTITPAADRSASYHYPLTNLYPNCVQIVGYGWTPNFWADIKLVHPLPNSGIDGYDPRVIGIIPANAGVSFNYPSLAAQGNNKVVLNQDGYTKLYDNLGGSIAGNTNPFICYFKSQPYRVWASRGTTSDTIRWNMNLSGFGGPIVYKLVVDVSTNYPATPTPVTDNAKEPLIQSIQVGSGLTPTGGSATVEVVVLDWQGTSGSNVQVEAPALFNGLVNLSYDSSPGSNLYKYKGTISNTRGAGVGEYPIMVAAFDSSTQIYNYLEGKAKVEQPQTSKVTSINFRAKDTGDTWFDIAVQKNGPVYVVADHPATGNVGGSGENGKRTLLKFNQSLSTMDVINSGTGMASPYPDNWEYTEEFRRVDVSDGGTVVTDVGGNTLGTWIITGTTATNYACCWQYQCGLMSTIADVADHTNPPGYGTGINCIAMLNPGCNPQVEWTLAFPDSNPSSYSGFNYAASKLFADVYSIKGMDCIAGTLNQAVLYSSATEGKLCIVGDAYSAVGNLNIINSTGSYGTGNGQFKGGLDLAMDSKGNILTLEDHGGTYRFQKFTNALVWVWTSPWTGSGKPQRMDFDKQDDQLYLLCDTGIHICTVE